MLKNELGPFQKGSIGDIGLISKLKNDLGPLRKGSIGEFRVEGLGLISLLKNELTHYWNTTL